MPKKARLGAGVPACTADALAKLFAERRKGMESEVFDDVIALLGRRATSLDVFAKRNTGIFRGEEPRPKL